MVLKRFGGTLVANDVNKILWNKFIGTRWRFVYSCRQRTVRIERCIKSASLSLFGSRFSAAAARTDTSQMRTGCFPASERTRQRFAPIWVWTARYIPSSPSRWIDLHPNPALSTSPPETFARQPSMWRGNTTKHILWRRRKQQMHRSDFMVQLQ